MTQHDNLGCSVCGHEDMYHHRPLHNDTYEFNSLTACAMCSCVRFERRGVRIDSGDASIGAGVFVADSSSRVYDLDGDGSAIRGMVFALPVSLAMWAGLIFGLWKLFGGGW